MLHFTKTLKLCWAVTCAAWYHFILHSYKANKVMVGVPVWAGCRSKSEEALNAQWKSQQTDPRAHLWCVAAIGGCPVKLNVRSPEHIAPSPSGFSSSNYSATTLSPAQGQTASERSNERGSVISQQVTAVLSSPLAPSARAAPPCLPPSVCKIHKQPHCFTAS